MRFAPYVTQLCTALHPVSALLDVSLPTNFCRKEIYAWGQARFGHEPWWQDGRAAKEAEKEKDRLKGKLRGGGNFTLVRAAVRMHAESLWLALLLCICLDTVHGTPCLDNTCSSPSG